MLAEGQALRNFAIDLLDDEHGINSQAYKTLDDMLCDNGDQDVIAAVKDMPYDDGKRYYLTSEDADKLRQVVKEDVLDEEGDQGGEG